MTETARRIKDWVLVIFTGLMFLYFLVDKAVTPARQGAQLSERVARIEEKVDNINKKVDRFEMKLDAHVETERK